MLQGDFFAKICRIIYDYLRFLASKKYSLWYNNRINPVIIQIYMPAQFVALRQRAMADYTMNSFGVMV